MNTDDNTAGIIHSVIFCLKYEVSDAHTDQFLRDAKFILAQLPSVTNFQVLRQVSSKCNYDFGFSMLFKTQEDYEAYNNHPSHQAFVAERWNREVVRFQEIDYVTY